jgi:hypothetical protein
MTVADLKRTAAPRRGPRIVDEGPLPLKLLDWLDSRVLQHPFYGFCTWLAGHPAWRPTSAAHPRPGGKPFYLPPNCPQCGTPLVLLDSLDRPPLSPDKVWYDEWICPNWPPPNGGVWMDWPAGEWAAIEKSQADFTAADYVTLEERTA